MQGKCAVLKFPCLVNPTFVYCSSKRPIRAETLLAVFGIPLGKFLHYLLD